MEPSCSALLDVLFEGQEEGDSSAHFSTPDTKLCFPLQDHAYGCSVEKAYEPWAGSSGQGLDGADGTRDLSQLLIQPNDACDSHSPVASPGSDSRVSEDPCTDPPLPVGSGAPDLSPGVIYEVICDNGFLKAAPLDPSFSSSFETWTPLTMLPEACDTKDASATNETHAVGILRDQDSSEQLHLTGFYLTDEERRLLNQEGISLQSGLPLTKAEERILKKVRRKIRNKQSAQDSRRRKKEYIDGLESRAAACSAQNQELRKKVHELEVHQVSLMEQLHRLQNLLKRTSTKAVQTGSCLLILMVSLGLFILPSCTSLLGGSKIHQEDYQPSGVISRNILNQGGFSDPEEPSVDADGPELSPVWTALRQEGFSTEEPPVLGGGGLNNTSGPRSPENSRAEPKEGAAEPKRGRDPGKQTHTDEM